MSGDIGRLPNWLADVPIKEVDRQYVEVADGVQFPLDVLSDAREIGVGSTMGLFSVVSPELRQALVEFTERPGWKDLPTQPTSITRALEDGWIVSVGDRQVGLTRSQIAALIESAQETE